MLLKSKILNVFPSKCLQHVGLEITSRVSKGIFLRETERERNVTLDLSQIRWNASDDCSSNECVSTVIRLDPRRESSTAILTITRGEQGWLQ